jgi:translation initiation factor IF-3
MIRAREVRVIGADGQQLGIMTVGDAQQVADEKNLDLVEVAPNANPPVCRVMDFHKYRYEQRKKSADSKKKSTASSVKEVKIRSRTEAHDLAFKTAHIRRFLELGHRVKISVFFKGREIARPELGRATLERMLQSIADAASAEGEPRMEGRNLSVMLVPTKAALHVAPAAGQQKEPQQKERQQQDEPQQQKENS